MGGSLGGWGAGKETDGVGKDSSARGEGEAGVQAAGASGLLGNGAGGRGLEKLPSPRGRERDAPAGPAPARR